jgi:hypothetical protein
MQLRAIRDIPCYFVAIFLLLIGTVVAPADVRALRAKSENEQDQARVAEEAPAALPGQ